MMLYSGTCHTPYRQTGGIQVQCHSVLAPALDVGEWPASLHGRFIPIEQEGGSIAYLQKKEQVGHLTATSAAHIKYSNAMSLSSIQV